MSDDQADTDDSTAALIEAFMKERAYKETLRWTFNLFHFYVVFSILRGNQESVAYFNAHWIRSLILNILTAQAGAIIGAIFFGGPVINCVSDFLVLVMGAIMWFLVYKFQFLGNKVLKYISIIGWEARRITVILSSVERAANLKYAYPPFTSDETLELGWEYLPIVALTVSGFIIGTALKWAAPIYNAIVCSKQLKWDIVDTPADNDSPAKRKFIWAKRIFYIICFMLSMTYAIVLRIKKKDILTKFIIMIIGWVVLIIVKIIEKIYKDKSSQQVQPQQAPQQPDQRGDLSEGEDDGRSGESKKDQ